MIPQTQADIEGFMASYALQFTLRALYEEKRENQKSENDMSQKKRGFRIISNY